MRSNTLQVCLVGYTNAGKTTIMSAFTDADRSAENKLFATLESTTRRLNVDFKPKILLSDTVGFIKNIPHNLVASFRSTLQVAKMADLLLHVVDASDNPDQHIEVTQQVLQEIGAQDVPQILIVNKIDKCSDNDVVIEGLQKHKFCAIYYVSGIDNTSLATCLAGIKNHFLQQCHYMQLQIPYSAMPIFEELKKHLMVYKLLHEPNFAEARVYVHAKYLHNINKLNEFVVN